MADESYWINKAQTAEAQLASLKEAYGPALERIKEFKANFGVKERSDGSLVIDYDRFAEALGFDGALELRAVIDEKYQISGDAGEKPKVKRKAA